VEEESGGGDAVGDAVALRRCGVTFRSAESRTAESRTPVTTLVVTYRKACFLSLAIYQERSEREREEGKESGKQF
jgi:hypothetical protein